MALSRTDRSGDDTLTERGGEVPRWQSTAPAVTRKLRRWLMNVNNRQAGMRATGLVRAACDGAHISAGAEAPCYAIGPARSPPSPDAPRSRMNPVFADLPTTIFEVMSRPRPRPRRDQSRPGLSRRSRPRGRARARPPRRVLRRLEPVSADDGPAGPARGRSPRITRIIRASTSIPRREVMVTSGATEALAGALLALIAPGRRGRAVRADVRRLPAAGAAGRRRAALRDAAAARTSASTRRRWRRRSRTATRVVLLNNPLNPSRHDLRPRGPRRCSPRFCSRHDVDRGLRRGLGARRLRRRAGTAR